MTGRILVVDAVPTNRIILRVKLSSAYYEVVQAASGAAALALLRKGTPDLVLTAAELPDMTGRALCAHIRQRSRRVALPVVIVHDGDDPAERLASLAAGADDALSRPIDDAVMMARLRSLLRARDAEAELNLRDDTRRALGLAEAGAEFGKPGIVHVVARPGLPPTDRLINGLAARISDTVIAVPPEKALSAMDPPPDVIVIAEALGCGGEGLNYLPQLRANRGTRHAALIYIARPGQMAEAASALDMGANDLLTSGLDVDELAVRLKKQIARKRTNDRLRSNMQDGLRAALVDPLTGLFNRRYALPHLTRLADSAAEKRRPYAVLLADLDHFKAVNDEYGHDAGDAVLAELGARLRENLRAADLIARWGGEEFLVAMPDADRTAARATAERICALMADRPVRLPDGTTLRVTLSVGVASILPGSDEQPLDLVKRADSALYAAKNAGRNTLVMADTVRPLTNRHVRPALPPSLQPGDGPKSAMGGGKG